MDRWAKELKAITRTTLVDVKVSGEKSVLIAGQLNSVRTIQTKSGRLMAVGSLQDAHGQMDVTVFSSSMTSAKEILKAGQLFICKGPVGIDDFSGGVKMVADDLMPIRSLALESSANR